MDGWKYIVYYSNFVYLWLNYGKCNSKTSPQEGHNVTKWFNIVVFVLEEVCREKIKEHKWVEIDDEKFSLKKWDKKERLSGVFTFFV